MNATHQSGFVEGTKSSKRLPLAVSVPLTVGMVLTSTVMPVSAMADQSATVMTTSVEEPAQVQVPAADILDVDFSDGSATDNAQNLQIIEHGNPQIELDPALGRNAATFDGEAALQYPFGEQYDQITDSFSVECVFRYNGALPNSGQTNMCANKEGGGFAVAMFANKLTFELHTGSYQNIGVEIEPNQWYHAVATYDGAEQTATLYVNGEVAAEVDTVGSEIVWPGHLGAHNMTLGADSSTNGAQFFSTSTLASARVFSDALTADQVAAMNTEAFAGLQNQTTEIASSTPAAGEHVTGNTTFDIEWEEPALVARDTTYTLDGAPINPGDDFGVGLTSGEHIIGIEGKTVFGQPISETITFSSGSIPETGGTDAAQGQGAVTISARAINPDGGDVTSTFYAGETDIAQEGFQGLTHDIPTTLEFE